MKDSTSRMAIVCLLVVFFGVNVGLLYTIQTERFLTDTKLYTKDVSIRTAQDQARYYKRQHDVTRNQLKTKLSELEQKSAELEAKKREIDTANKELAVKIKELNSTKSQLSTNTSELNKLRSRPPLFNFHVASSSIQNVEAKKEDVKDLVTSAYDVIEQIYSKPYLLHAVTISFVDSFSNPNAAAETVITNGPEGLSLTVKIRDFNKNDFNDINDVIHEIIHSFHGLSVLDPVAYEEGITVAAADAVMERLITLGKIPAFKPLYIRIAQSQYSSSSLTIPRDTNQLYSSSNVGMYYQLAGYGWYQLYKADNNFFKNFNEKIYEQKRQGKEVTEEMVKSAIRDSLKTNVQGQSVNDWLNTKAFALN